MCGCSNRVAAEQKARKTYDNILRLVDDPDVLEPIRFLREREVVHFQRFGDALRITQENLDAKNFYAFNSNGNKGIACGLGNIQKIRDGEPLGGRTNAADDFATDVDDDFLS